MHFIVIYQIFLKLVFRNKALYVILYFIILWSMLYRQWNGLIEFVNGAFHENFEILYYWSQHSKTWYANIKCTSELFFPTNISDFDHEKQNFDIFEKF